MSDSKKLPRMLGWALGLPRIWDALSDPLMGNIPDNTRTRFGRRRPLLPSGLFGPVTLQGMGK